MGRPRKKPARYCSPAQSSAKKVKRKYSTKSPGRIRRALYQVESENKSVRKTADEYGLSYSFLQRRLSGKINIDSKNGPKTVFTPREEEKMATYLSEMASRGMGLRTEEFLDFVKNIVDKENRQTPFINNRPGYDWYTAFMKRNSDIIQKRKETLLESSRSKVTPQAVDEWFTNYSVFISDLELLDKPERIYNADETGFSMGSKSGDVVGPAKCVYSGPVPHVSGGKSKERVTVMYCANADGTVIPPFFVFAKPKPVAYDLLAGTCRGSDAEYTDKGWMDIVTFKKFIKHLDKFAEKERPIVLLVDSVGCHVNIDCFTLAKELGIEVYRLVRNATHLMQPLDVGVYGPLKSAWYKHLRNHKRQYPNDPVNKKNFGRHVHTAFMQFYKPLTVQHAFQSAGIYPLSRESISDQRLKPALTYQPKADSSNTDIVQPVSVLSQDTVDNHPNASSNTDPVQPVSVLSPDTVDNHPNDANQSFTPGLDMLVQAMEMTSPAPRSRTTSNAVSPVIEEAIKIPVVVEKKKKQVRLNDQLSDHLTSEFSLRTVSLKKLQKVRTFAQKERKAKERYLKSMEKEKSKNKRLH